MAKNVQETIDRFSDCDLPISCCQFGKSEIGQLKLHKISEKFENWRTTVRILFHQGLGVMADDRGREFESRPSQIFVKRYARWM